MNKYLTLYTLIIILIVNVVVHEFVDTCIDLYAELGTALPLATEISWIAIEENIYLLFSVLTMAVIILIPFTRIQDRSGSIGHIIIGLHLLVLSMFIFSIMLPFVSMCENIG